jgi:hypothetical protein
MGMPSSRHFHFLASSSAAVGRQTLQFRQMVCSRVPATHHVSHQLPRDVLVQNFQHGQGVLAWWLRLKSDSISANAPGE